jgi:hypothetical protein
LSAKTGKNAIKTKKLSPYFFASFADKYYV